MLFKKIFTGLCLLSAFSMAVADTTVTVKASEFHDDTKKPYDPTLTEKGTLPLKPNTLQIYQCSVDPASWAIPCQSILVELSNSGIGKGTVLPIRPQCESTEAQYNIKIGFENTTNQPETVTIATAEALYDPKYDTTQDVNITCKPISI